MRLLTARPACASTASAATPRSQAEKTPRPPGRRTPRARDNVKGFKADAQEQVEGDLAARDCDLAAARKDGLRDGFPSDVAGIPPPRVGPLLQRRGFPRKHQPLVASGIGLELMARVAEHDQIGAGERALVVVPICLIAQRGRSQPIGPRDLVVLGDDRVAMDFDRAGVIGAHAVSPGVWIGTIEN